MHSPSVNRADGAEPGVGALDHQRELTRTDRATVGSTPEATLARLVDLPRTIGPGRGLDFDGWPDGGLSDLATFRVGGPGTADVAYEMRSLEEATGLALRATGPQWTADHHVDVHALPDGSSEVTWQLTLSSNVPLTDVSVTQAAALSTATLQALGD